MINFIKSEKFYLPIIYIVLGIIIYGIIKVIIGKISKNKYVDKKKITIISLIKNIFKYLIFILVILSILNIYGVNTTSIIASIGIVGVIIGLALQDIVADFLAGIFILFDNQYTIGDTVSINGFKGEVISFGLMSTKIKAPTGETLIISNSSFKEVINYSINKTVLYITLDVAYNTDIDLLEKVLKSLEKEVLKIENVLGSYQLLGINEFSSSSIKYMVSINCKPNTHYQIKRDYLKLINDAFHKNNIEIPYNKLDVNIRSNDE